jgi:hypothetical protein
MDPCFLGLRFFKLIHFLLFFKNSGKKEFSTEKVLSQDEAGQMHLEKYKL